MCRRRRLVVFLLLCWNLFLGIGSCCRDTFQSMMQEWTMHTIASITVHTTYETRSTSEAKVTLCCACVINVLRMKSGNSSHADELRYDTVFPTNPTPLITDGPLLEAACKSIFQLMKMEKYNARIRKYSTPKRSESTLTTNSMSMDISATHHCTDTVTRCRKDTV